MEHDYNQQHIYGKGKFFNKITERIEDIPSFAPSTANTSLSRTSTNTNKQFISLRAQRIHDRAVEREERAQQRERRMRIRALKALRALKASKANNVASTTPPTPSTIVNPIVSTQTTIKTIKNNKASKNNKK